MNPILELLTKIPTADQIAYYDMSNKEMAIAIGVLVILAYVFWSLIWKYEIKDRMGA